MSSTNKNSDNDKSENDESMMMDPNAPEINEDELCKTHCLTDEELESIEKQRLKTLFGVNAALFSWQSLNDETKVEQVEKFTNGAYGDVFWLRCKKDGKSLIVKKNRTDNDKFNEAKTANEVKQMMRVKSEYTISCYGYSPTDDQKGTIAIIMEYGGLRLDCLLISLFNKGTLEIKLRTVLENLLIQAAAGISDIHQEGLIHRDIKDGNIFVNEIEPGIYLLKIGDFGIARDIKEGFTIPELQNLMAGDSDYLMTKIGTPFYMAPEISTSAIYTEKVDCFSWGKMALRCHRLCGFIEGEFITGVTEKQMSKNFITAIQNSMIDNPEFRSSANKILEDLELKLEWKRGNGKRFLPDGKVYTGEFNRFKLNGRGRLSWPDGKIYEGLFRNDKMHGQGTLNWPDGRKFTGQFENDARNGQGTMEWPDKDFDHPENDHTSNIPEDENSGKSKPLNFRRKSYVGMFHHDQIDGQGKLTYYNTDYQHEGNFEKDVIKGPGKRTYVEGEYNGIFLEAEFDNRETKGSVTIVNKDSKYVGPIKENDLENVLRVFTMDKYKYQTVVLICIDTRDISFNVLKFYLENYHRTSHKLHFFSAITRSKSIKRVPSNDNIEEQMTAFYSSSFRKNSRSFSYPNYIFKQEYVEKKAQIGNAIVRYAKSISANMIIAGTRNLKGIDKFMTLGSVSDYLMKNCECPVTIVRI